MCVQIFAYMTSLQYIFDQILENGSKSHIHNYHYHMNIVTYFVEFIAKIPEKYYNTYALAEITLNTG